MYKKVDRFDALTISHVSLLYCCSLVKMEQLEQMQCVVRIRSSETVSNLQPRIFATVPWTFEGIQAVSHCYMSV